MTTPLEIFAANRDLALAEAEAAQKSGWYSAASHSYGQSVAYAEAIRILQAAKSPLVQAMEQFRCAAEYHNGQPCGRVAKLRSVDGGFRWCDLHAPADQSLTISEHDDQREAK
jgi:hypothetical protein